METHSEVTCRVGNHTSYRSAELGKSPARWLTRGDGKRFSLLSVFVHGCYETRDAIAPLNGDRRGSWVTRVAAPRPMSSWPALCAAGAKRARRRSGAVIAHDRI